MSCVGVSRASRSFATRMLASGVVLGIAAAIAFGGDWRRLGNLSLSWWPLLIVASALRFFTFLQPHASLEIYVVGLFGIGLVAALNWRIPGAGVRLRLIRDT